MLRMGEKANLLLHLGWHRDEITLSELSQQDFGEYLYVPEQLKQSLQEQAHLSQCQWQDKNMGFQSLNYAWFI